MPMCAARGEKGSHMPMATARIVENKSGGAAVSWIKGVF